MQRIIQLLEQKNHYLEKFYSLNETELKNFSVGIFDTLESFYQMRDKLLDMIRYLDSELEVASQETRALSEDDRRVIRKSMAIKDEYVNRILAQDLEILSSIELAKSNIIKELQDIKMTKKVMGHYKSGTLPHRRLDEEV